MATYTNISSVATTTLVSKITSAQRRTNTGTITRGNPGDISSINISNHDNSDQVIIKLYLHDGSNTYVITETTIPPLVTLFLDNNLSYDGTVYDLKIDTSTTAELTVTIK